MHKNEYKVIACDLDGTLIGSDMKLSPENYEAIRELTKQGVEIVPVTGRTLCEMKDVFDLPEIRYAIYSNGAAIFDKQTGETTFLGLGEHEVRFVYDLIQKYDTFTILHKDGKTFADKQKAQKLGEYNVCFNVKCLVKDYCTLVEDLDSKFLEGGIESIVVFFADINEREECRQAILKNPKLYAVGAWEHNLEIFFKAAGKGTALECLAGKLGLSMKDVISVGDSDNDMQMIHSAGEGLAVQNGCEALKKTADRMICSNDEHIMCYIQKHYFSK